MNLALAYLVSVLRDPVPVRRVAGDIILFDGGRFSKLRGCRSVEVEAYHPHACAIQYFTLLLLRLGWNHRHLVEIEIRRDPV